jgi:hypothetical protein
VEVNLASLNDTAQDVDDFCIGKKHKKKKIVEDTKPQERSEQAKKSRVYNS